jgi:hypothetical protein
MVPQEVRTFSVRSLSRLATSTPLDGSPDFLEDETLSPPVTTSEPQKWFDVGRRDIRDALIVLALGSIVLLSTGTFLIAKFGFDHAGDERFQLLSVTLGLTICAALALMFGIRRLQDLRREILARIAAEQKAAASSSASARTTRAW